MSKERTPDQPEAVKISYLFELAGSKKTGFNWNQKAGYDLKPNDLVYIFEVHNGWGRIYTGNLIGHGSNDWIHLDRLIV